MSDYFDVGILECICDTLITSVNIHQNLLSKPLTTTKGYPPKKTNSSNLCKICYLHSNHPYKGYLYPFGLNRQGAHSQALAVSAEAWHLLCVFQRGAAAASGGKRMGRTGGVLSFFQCKVTLQEQVCFFQQKHVLKRHRHVFVLFCPTTRTKVV